jgi:hypothetical protein
MRSAIPLLDPVSTVIMNANSGNVDAVMVSGEFVKRDGRLLHTDIKLLSARLEASAKRLAAAFSQIRPPQSPI